MGQKRIRVRTKRTEDGVTDLFVLISHPMETGQRVNPQTQEKIPAHFIQKLSFQHNGKEVAVMDMGQGVSKDPLINIRLPRTARGDKIRIAWSDNLGEKDEDEFTITENA